MTDIRAKLQGLIPDNLKPRSARIFLDLLEVMADIGFHDFEVESRNGSWSLSKSGSTIFRPPIATIRLSHGIMTSSGSRSRSSRRAVVTISRNRWFTPFSTESHLFVE